MFTNSYVSVGPCLRYRYQVVVNLYVYNMYLVPTYHIKNEKKYWGSLKTNSYIPKQNWTDHILGWFINNFTPIVN